jgi:hypothetical protein
MEANSEASAAENVVEHVSAGKPEAYFIVHNIAKKHNVGTVARCATAFGIKSVCLIGAAWGLHPKHKHKKLATFTTFHLPPITSQPPPPPPPPPPPAAWMEDSRGMSGQLHGPHRLSAFACLDHTPYEGCHSTPGCQIGYMHHLAVNDWFCFAKYVKNVSEECQPSDATLQGARATTRSGARARRTTWTSRTTPRCRTRARG